MKNIPFLPTKKEKKSSGASSGTGTSGGESSSSSFTTGQTKSGDEVIMDVANRFVKQPIEGLMNGISNVVEKVVVPFPTSSSSSSGKKKDGEKVAFHTKERTLPKKESSSSTNNSSLPGTSTTKTKTASPSSSISSTTPQATTKDETLQNMQIILQNQSLKQISIKEFYDACFGEGSDMYESWINSYGDKYNIQITPWEYNTDDDGQQFTNEWNDEKFPQRRIITYSYDRDPSTLGYSLGEPTVHVTQVQYFSQTTNRGILSVEMSMVGEVCANCFHVQIRGVATQIGCSGDVSVDFGVYCVFTKQVLIGGKIRDITKDATQSQMIDMFAMIQQYCGQQQDTTTTTTKKTASIPSATLNAAEEEKEEYDDQGNKDKNDITSCWQQYLCDPFKTKNQEKLDQPMDDIDLELHAIDRKYRSICLLHLVVVDPSKPSSTPQLPPSEIKFIKSEFDIAKESLNHILVRDIQAEKLTTSTAAAASTSETTTSSSKGAGSLIERPRPFKKTMTKIRERIVPRIDSVGVTTNTLFNKVASLSAVAAENIVPVRLTETTGLSIGRQQQPVVDASVNGMNVIIKDTIEDTSLDEFYNAIFKEDIFLPTLEKSGKFNIQLGPWEKSQGDHNKKDDELFVDSWNGERYLMRRNFSYDYRVFNNRKNNIVKRNSNSNSSSNNKEEEEKLTSRASRTFFARRDGNSKVVLQIRDDGSSNVRVSNSCEVMIRWVVTPIVDGKAKNKNSSGSNPGRNRLLVKIGQFVVMKNHSVLACKLRSEATRYAMHSQRQILKEFKVILGANQDSAGNETDSLLQEAGILSDENTLLLGETKNVDGDTPCFSFRQCLPCDLCETSRFPPGTIIASDDDLVTMATNLELKLKAVHAILEADRKFADSAEDLHFYLSQLFIVREALDNILQKYCNHDEKPLEEVRNLSNGFF